MTHSDSNVNEWAESSPSSVRRFLSSARFVLPELREVIAAIQENFEGPTSTIREALGSSAAVPTGSSGTVALQLSTVLEMCDDVHGLSRRYLDFLAQIEAMPEPQMARVRPDEVLAEVDRRLMPEAFGRGIAWTCGAKGPIGTMRTDAALCVDGLCGWAALAIASAQSGDAVSLMATGSRAPVLTLRSSAMDLVADLTTLLDDPLFNRTHCLEEVGTDPGSKLALSIEQLDRAGGRIELDPEGSATIRTVRFRFDGASPGPSRLT